MRHLRGRPRRCRGSVEATETTTALPRTRIMQTQTLPERGHIAAAAVSSPTSIGRRIATRIFVRLIPHGLAAFMAAVFLDSLRYKFTDHPKTQVIFGRLND